MWLLSRIGYFLLVTLLTISRVSAENPQTYRLVLGVYSVNPAWDKIVRSTMNKMYRNESWRDHLDIEVIYITQHFHFDMQGIILANETLQQTTLTMLLGPYNPSLHLAAAGLSLPYLVTTVPDDVTYHYTPFTFLMRPPDDIVHKAAIDVILKYKWQEVVVLYDTQQGLQLMGDLMEADSYKPLRIRSWYMKTNITDALLKDQLIKLRTEGQTKICLVCDPALVTRIFAMALQFSMLSYLYSWMVITLNPYTTDYSNYTMTQVNFTTFEPCIQPADYIHIPLNASFLDNIIAYQTLSLITNASYQYTIKERNRTQGMDCEGGFGCSNFIKGTDITHSFYKHWPESNNTMASFQNGTNELSAVHLNTVGLKEEIGLSVIGQWQSHLPEHDRLDILVSNKSVFGPHSFPKKVYSIVTILDPPFVMYTHDHKNKEGKEKFKGFLLDLIEKIATKLNFEYDVYEVPDKSYGSKNDDGTWNGMINELIQGNADMCLGAISITSEREEVVDFTKPFMQKSYNLLIKKPNVKTSIFQFLWPLSTDVWILTIGSIILLGFTLFAMDWLSPNSKDPNFRFNMKESIWFIYGTLVGAGTEMVPRTISGRLLTGAWWFFALILISSYTANLAAFLTVTKIDTPIRSLSDLVQQTIIKYGTVRNTNAHMFFRNNKLAPFEEMWRFMNLNNGLVDNSTEGLQRVQDGEYAFVWDTPVNKYMTMENCDVMTVGEPFDQKGYGIGVPRGVSYRDDLTMMILTINEQGIIQELENKWWSGSECEAFQDTSTARTKELNFYNVAGVFLVLGVGTVLALIASVIEYMVFKVKSNRKKKKEAAYQNDQELQTSLYTNNYSAEPSIKRQKSWMFR